VIAYLDASALVKRYVVERGSRETIALTADAEITATSIVSRAEVAAALGKAVRIGLVTENVARTAQRSFASDWPDLARVPVTEALVERAEALAWEHGLRGYDAVQLASALTWRESVGQEIVVATFARQLWEAAIRTGLKPWPAKLAGQFAT
jgi:predicted nucleic acid-binding protein